jgi:hypothetical protein
VCLVARADEGVLGNLGICPGSVGGETGFSRVLAFFRLQKKQVGRTWERRGWGWGKSGEKGF